ncbi:AAA family ATPase [Maribacter confluentis]|uniref:AAA family ATPase n=1 Tax=Maribacter confluentis TaxID=1656093 RepID=A0ABT8RPK8_9FLAO|nr:AAA family ATPase [Maribacter confluentis]MDO1512071.1 AAA family ATPase [Maribacter confluentis]
MKLNKFRAAKVHGYLNYDIEFYDDITFLIGINGSGKTSALKLILGLVSPSFNYLNQIDFEFAELICSTKINEEDITITATQNKNDNTFSINLKSPFHNGEPVIFPRYIRSDNENYDYDEISVIEQNLREKFEFNEIAKNIRELATPKFLGLDRKIYEGKNIDLRFRNRRIYNQHKPKKKIFDGSSGVTAIDSSLEDVQFLIFEYFRKIAYEQPKISEEFKRKIFQLSFKFNDNHNLESIPTDDNYLIEKREKVLKAIKNLDIGFLDYSANSFFDKMSDLIVKRKELDVRKEKSKSNPEGRTKENQEEFKVLMKWINNSSQIKRIDEIINYSQTYQEKISDLRSPIKRLESITSKFLDEGGKQIKIAEDGEIKVRLRNGKEANVFELSSGEKQIIIMIAHLIFEEDQKPSGVFIIDEPELSLHIAWQEIFVDSIMEASPKTQFILATHSPSIISKVIREVKCQDLNKLNS